MAFFAFTHVSAGDVSDVVVDGYAGPVVGEDASSPLVDLRKEDVLESCSFETNVHPSRSAE
jgi:hypothetical protein